MLNLNPFLLLIFMLKIYGVSLYECPIIKCNSGESDLVNDTCFSIIFSEGIPKIELNSCMKGQFCDIPKLNIKDISNLRDPIKCTNFTLGYWSNMKPGGLVEKDYCYLNSDCSSNICTNNECLGKLNGMKCKHDSECQNNHFCNTTSNSCTKTVNLGDECYSNKMCPSQSGCLFGICTEFNSLIDGTKIYNENLGIYCESGYVNGENGMCEGLMNVGTPPYLCDDKSMCSYRTTITNNIIYKDSCLCDFSGNGKSYCMLSTSSKEYSSYINAKRDLIQSSNMCNYKQETGCLSTKEDSYINFLKSYLNLYQLLNNYTTELIPCLIKEIPSVNPAKCNVFPCENSLINQQVIKEVFLNYSSTQFDYLTNFIIILSSVLLIL